MWLTLSSFRFTVLPSSGKRTQRIEHLRDAMGAEAFSEMVDQQLWIRRNRSVPSGGQEWTQTLQWWHSDEGRLYWHGPPQPDPWLVRDTLLQSRRGLRGLLNLQQPLEKHFEVPKSLVSFLALRTTHWLQDRQEGTLPGISCRCFVLGMVNFDRAEGERVPSVHISCKEDSGNELVLLLSCEVFEHASSTASSCWNSFRSF